MLTYVKQEFNWARSSSIVRIVSWYWGWDPWRPSSTLPHELWQDKEMLLLQKVTIKKDNINAKNFHKYISNLCNRNYVIFIACVIAIYNIPRNITFILIYVEMLRNLGRWYFKERLKSLFFQRIIIGYEQELWI